MAAIVVMGFGVFALKTCVEMLTQPSNPSGPAHPGFVSHLPGGYIVWQAAPLASVLILSTVFLHHGPRAQPYITSLKDVNTALSTLLPNGNTRLHRILPETAGDCEAYWDHVQAGLRQHLPIDSAAVLLAWDRNKNSTESRCKGHGPLAHKSSHTGLASVDATAVWLTGLNTLEITAVRVLPPSAEETHSKQWTVDVSGVLKDMHLWMKVLLDGKVWADDYLCCDQAFHFQLQASMVCSETSGFSPVSLHLTHTDPIDFKHRIHSENGALTWDYGRQEVVEKALANFVAGNNSRLLLKTWGETLDIFSEVSSLIEDVVKLNTGHVCPRAY
jgi:hypothetical protein